MKKIFVVFAFLAVVSAVTMLINADDKSERYNEESEDHQLDYLGV